MGNELETLRIGVLDFTVIPYDTSMGRGSTRTKEVWLTGKKGADGKFIYSKVNISKDICQQAGLKEGDRVNLVCSKDHTQMALIRHKVGVFTLKAVGKTAKSLTINSTTLALDIRSNSSWGHSASTDRFRARVIDGCVVFERMDNDE